MVRTFLTDGKNITQTFIYIEIPKMKGRSNIGLTRKSWNEDMRTAIRVSELEEGIAYERRVWWLRVSRQHHTV